MFLKTYAEGTVEKTPEEITEYLTYHCKLKISKRKTIICEHSGASDLHCLGNN